MLDLFNILFQILVTNPLELGVKNIGVFQFSHNSLLKTYNKGFMWYVTRDLCGMLRMLRCFWNY